MSRSSKPSKTSELFYSHSVFGMHQGILLAVFMLIGMGLVQVYSSSFIFAFESRGDGMFFFKRQLVFAAIAVAVLLIAAKVPWRLLVKYGYLLWGFAAISVALLLLPGLSIRAGGAVRWLKLPGGFVFEPGEFIKIALVFLLATFASRSQSWLGGYKWPFRVVCLMVPLLLVLRQPDFGTFAICCVVTIAFLFVFGLPWIFLAAGLTAVIPSFWLLVMRVPYRRERVMAFLDPWSDPSQKGFQVIQSMLSFHSGGLFGTGLGEGQGKLFFLPEAHTDFTLAVMGEEMGFLGITALLAIYAYLSFRSMQIAMNCRSTYARSLALGLGLIFSLTTLINFGVALGLLPTKGLTLPFMSYGGSSLVMSCFLFGILLNVERNRTVPDAEF